MKGPNIEAAANKHPLFPRSEWDARLWVRTQVSRGLMKTFTKMIDSSYPPPPSLLPCEKAISQLELRSQVGPQGRTAIPSPREGLESLFYHYSCVWLSQA